MSREPQEISIIGPIGSGRRCTAWRANSWGQDFVVKLYSDRAIAKHAARYTLPIARFEYERNLSLFTTHGLRGKIARPLGFVSRGVRQVFLQEFVTGVPLASFAVSASESERLRVNAALVSIVRTAHEHAIFDLDLHPSNVLVMRSVSGLPDPVLFDFNKIPYHEWPPNAAMRAFVAFGRIRRESRDLRGLRTIRRVLRLPA
ncbi:MAG: hypothetical protein WD795_03690 [Woeseia sp.]